MALAVYTFDLPLPAGALHDYERAGQERIVRILDQPGVREFRAYRHPLGIAPQVMVQIEFESVDAVQAWHASAVYHDVLSDLLREGCRNIMVDVWDSSPVVPAPLFARRRAD
jgi:hypothetical protein